MNCIAPELRDHTREYVLAELRCAMAKARLAQLDLQAAATALHYGLITPEQAIGLFWDSEAIAFLGLEIGAGS